MYQFKQYQLSNKSKNPVIILTEISDYYKNNELNIVIHLKNGVEYNINFIRSDYRDSAFDHLSEEVKKVYNV